MTEENCGGKTEASQTITAKETLWVTTRFEVQSDPDSNTEPELKLVDEEIGDAAEELESAWSYECADGETFESLDNAVEHVENTV